jgi:spermidine synthase
MPEGTAVFNGKVQDWKTVYQTNSFYGRIRVVDFPEEQQRVLLNDGLTQGRYNYGTKKPAVSFPYALADLLLEQKKDPENALVLGLGAGFVPRLLFRKIPDIRITAVEINPAMIDVADQYFDLPPHKENNTNFTVIQGDARVWVKNCTTKFDHIVLDTFLGDNTPGHLLSYEMFCDIRAILTDDGALAINIFGSMLGEQSRLIQSVVKTMKQGNRLNSHSGNSSPPLFPHIGLFSYEATTDAHNLYILASNKPLKKRNNGLVHFVPSFRKHWLRMADVSLVDQTGHLRISDDAPVLYDDFNPSEFLDIAVKENMRRDIREYWGDVLQE